MSPPDYPSAWLRPRSGASVSPGKIIAAPRTICGLNIPDGVIQDESTLSGSPRGGVFPFRRRIYYASAGSAPVRIQCGELTIQDCFQCHSTGLVSVSRDHEIQIMEPGVRCEVCHGPGDAHVEAVRGGDLG